MRTEEWFKSPSHSPRRQGEVYPYANLYEPSPVSLFIKPYYESSEWIGNSLQSATNQVKLEDSVVNFYLIPFENVKKER